MSQHTKYFDKHYVCVTFVIQNILLILYETNNFFQFTKLIFKVYQTSQCTYRIQCDQRLI